jgi:hypothetical protein
VITEKTEYIDKQRGAHMNASLLSISKSAFKKPDLGVPGQLARNLDGCADDGRGEDQGEHGDSDIQAGCELVGHGETSIYIEPI